MTSSLATVAYIGAAILFILSLGGLSNPETSRRGNLYGVIGMVPPGVAMHEPGLRPIDTSEAAPLIRQHIPAATPATGT